MEFSFLQKLRSAFLYEFLLSVKTSRLILKNVRYRMIENCGARIRYEEVSACFVPKYTVSRP